VRSTHCFPRFQKTVVAGAVEDDVVQKFDADDFTRRFELGGDGDVLCEGSRLPIGWLWATMMAAARSASASAKTSRG
jgi:hypothetical protein